MLLAIISFLTLFVSALSAEEAQAAVPAAEVRPEWTIIPQGDRVLPRIETTQSVIFRERDGFLMRC
jgi:hypothetical protein